MAGPPRAWCSRCRRARWRGSCCTGGRGPGSSGSGWCPAEMARRFPPGSPGRVACRCGSRPCGRPCPPGAASAAA
eukprot:1904309-Heterocapsa_arctica.AAC.1